MANALDSMRSVAEVLEILPAEETQHMVRVGILVDRFTPKLVSCGFMEDGFGEYKYFGSAAFYHDIGKAWIPHSILSKPGQLTKTERLMMCDHPVFAQKLFDRIRHGLISGIPGHLLQFAMDAAMYHHEWWNGNGYPYGIKYREIPLIARITSICDAYDAMTSNRVYRKGHSHDHAYQELIRCSGMQFDPNLVSVFLDADIHLDSSSKELLSYL